MLLLVGDRERAPLTSSSVCINLRVSSLQARVPPERVIPQRTRVLVYGYERETHVTATIYLLVNFKNRDVHILSFNSADCANRVTRLSIPRYNYNRTPSVLYPRVSLFAPRKKNTNVTKVKKI